MVAPSSAIGSSPRGRGTRRRDVHGAGSSRFIPARAGNTRASSPSRCSKTVHPRAGGEHPVKHHLGAVTDGSSPRGRGTLPVLNTLHETQRFIPARAGNTEATQAPHRDRTVHPRAGGEHILIRIEPVLQYGSSPRWRGTRVPWRHDRVPYRFIPARAGNTWPVHCIASDHPVHPRAGGEHGAKYATTPNIVGSSPRGRGTLPEGCAPAHRQRFIPALAGNTSRPSYGARRESVHPRAGGEHLSEG